MYQSRTSFDWRFSLSLDVSREAVRRLQLEKQGIGTLPRSVDKERVFTVIDRLGCLQIDTISVVERAHNVTLWSRLGCYDKMLLHDLAYKDRRVFEGLGHAASYLPLKDWRYFLHANKIRGEEYIARKGWFGDTDPGILDTVLGRIRNEGPLSSKDFDESKPGGSWWSWKPSKVALEALFRAGVLMVSHRENFQRYYDLTERVLPSWVDVSEPSEEERLKFFATRTLNCLGAIRPRDIRGYYYDWCVKTKRSRKELGVLLDRLVSEGDAVKLMVEGSSQPHYCLRTDASRLEELSHGWSYEDVRFHTYFDSLLWQRDRVDHLFGFEPVLEIYLRPEQRRFGYFNIPILYGDRFVGRFDPKLNREDRSIIVNGLWFETGFKPDEEFEARFGEALESFASFNGAEKVEWKTEKNWDSFEAAI
jgi:uncharacterized protein YcaQ